MLPVQNLSDVYQSQGMNNPQLTTDDNGNPIYQSTPVAAQPSLTDLYLGGGNSSAPATPQAETTPLTDAYLTSKEDTTHPSQTEKSISDNLKSVGSGALQGVNDVINTGGQAIGWLDKTISKLIGGEGEARSEAFNTRVNKENEDFAAQHGDDGFAQVGRIGGQIAATAPLTPVRAIQGIRAAAGALPTVLSTGERIAAPLAQRLLGASGAGAVGGATYGAATSSTDPRQGILPVAENIGTQAVGGALGGPIMEQAGTALKAIPGAIRTGLNKAAGNVASHAAGVNPKAAKQVLTELENEGMNIDEAQQAIQKMGPDATISDLTPALQKYAGALAARGGRTSSIIENRFKARNDLKNDVAHTEIDKAIGTKPDIEAEKQAIITKAHGDVAPDYQAAKASNQKLDITPAIKIIKDELKNAVGDKEKVLNSIGSYFLRKGSDDLKDSVAELHQVRIALDDMIDSKNPTTSLGNQTKSVLKNVRKSVDETLKTNPQMKAADAKFSKAMDLKNDLEYGQQALDKGNIEEFTKTFRGKSIEGQAAIKQGLRAAIGDKMEKAAQGELAGAQQLFGKKSVTRAKLKLAFGPAGDRVLDTLATQANLRGTEGLVSTGSRTALNQRINNSLDMANKPTSLLGDAIKGTALDVTTGSLGTGTAIMGAKHIGGNILTRFRESRHDAFAEGLADLLSRSGHGLDKTFDQLRKINAVRNVLAPRISSGNQRLKLPVASIAAPLVGLPIAKAGYNKLKALIQD